MDQATVKDPVCGKDVVPGTARGWDYNFENAVYHFCGSECRSRFNHDPKEFLGGHPAVPTVPVSIPASPQGWSFQKLIAGLRARFS